MERLQTERCDVMANEKAAKNQTRGKVNPLDRKKKAQHRDWYQLDLSAIV